MGIKDLVGLSEPPATAQENASPPESPTSTGSLRPAARFIQHQTGQVFPSNKVEFEGLPFAPTNYLTISGDFPHDDHSLELTADVTDELPPHPTNTSALPLSTEDKLQSKSSLFRRHASGHEPDAPNSDMQFLLSKMDHTYPPYDNTVVASSSSVGHKHTLLPHAQRLRTHAPSPHTPIPAVTVFSRNAAPLFLPKLDDYLAALPPPHFSPPSRGRDKDIGIFPPLDRLVSSGRTLEDLETNRPIIPSWRNRQTILGGLVNIFLGIMVRQMFLLHTTI